MTAIKTVLGLLIALLIAAALAYFQPWAEFPPAAMNRTFLPDERVENFRNMDKLYPSMPIRTSSTPQPWPGQSSSLEVAYEFNGEQRSLSDFLSRTFSTGFLVIKDGQIVHEQYRLGETASSLHTSWSVAKSFTSTMVGIAIDEGKINSVEDRVDRYIPELAGTAYGAASIKDVLQMSSGVDFREDYGAPGSNTAMAFSDIQKITNLAWGFGFSVNELVGDYAKAEEPGTRWEYRSSDTQILGWLVESVMQKPLPSLVEEYLWQPLNMESDANWLVDSSEERNAMAFCCLNATLRDYARFGELFRLGGSWNGKRIVSQQWVTEATTPDASHVQPDSVRTYRGYQYQWWVPDNYDREYFASGIWGQNIWVDEKRGIVIARTAVDPDFLPNMHESVVMFRAVSRQVAGF